MGFFPVSARLDDARIALAISQEPDRVAMLSDLTRLAERLEKKLGEESTTTRCHVGVVAERVEESVKLAAEVAAHQAAVLDGHESRLQNIDKRA